MSITIRQFGETDLEQWDQFCTNAFQATFLHTRNFLSYHLDRFIDVSLVIEDKGRLVGLFPAALTSGNEQIVVSHPGISYGGVLHHGGLRGERMIEAMNEIANFYRLRDHASLIYKAVPTFYHKAPAHDDLYALFRLGATRTRCDLSSTIDLTNRIKTSDRRRRSYKKAVESGIEISINNADLNNLWNILTLNLLKKYGVKPVHNFEEINLLANKFPNNIRSICAKLNNQIIAGIVIFITNTAYHSQYIASNEIGQELAALDLVFQHAINLASLDGKRWFDFGISTEDSGNTLNDGLYRFKTEFGSGGQVHEFYKLELKKF